MAKSITILIRTSPFQNKEIYYSNSKTIDFPIATDNSIEIVKTALIGLKSIFKEGFQYQKSGITLSGLSNPENNTNYRYGRSTLSLADAGLNKKWKVKREHSSKIDTADFYFLPTIKAS